RIVGERGDCQRFAAPESGFAFLLEDVRDIDAATTLDLVIGIDETHVPHLGQAPADGGLAGPHRANEKNVVGRHHRNTGSGIFSRAQYRRGKTLPALRATARSALPAAPAGLRRSAA